MSNMFVIVNEAGELYYGFESDTSRPLWKKTKRDGCELPEPLVDQVIKQLKALGHEKIVKRAAGGVIRKWVPADCDATSV